MTKGEALGEMLKLVEDGILVRNTVNDGDFRTYLTQANRLVVVLKEAKKALEEKDEDQNSERQPTHPEPQL